MAAAGGLVPGGDGPGPGPGEVETEAAGVEELDSGLENGDQNQVGVDGAAGDGTDGPETLSLTPSWDLQREGETAQSHDFR